MSNPETFPRSGEDYLGWDELPGQEADAGVEHDSHIEEGDPGQLELSEFGGGADSEYSFNQLDPDLRNLIVDFDVAEKQSRDVDNDVRQLMTEAQRVVEEQYRETGNILIYGIVEGEIGTKIVAPEGDAMSYPDENWVNDESERMMPLEYFVDASDININRELMGLREEMPEGLQNYGNRLIEDVRAMAEEVDMRGVEGLYIVPGMEDFGYEEE